MGDDNTVALTPITRSGTVSDAVFVRLIDEILSGRWPANLPAPSERDLAVAFQVNRHAVREALKRLQQAGLVQIGQGGKTRVLDWHHHAGLDMLASLAASGVVPLTKAFTDMAVMRKTVGVDAARLCALRATAEELAAVSAAAAAYPELGDLAAHRDADLAVWTAIIAGSGNVAYQLALNTLVRSVDEVGRDLYLGLTAVEFSDRGAHLDLATAICARDADAAARCADHQLSQLLDLLQAVTENEK